MLKFRKSHPHVDDDYQVIFEGIAVGSIKRRNSGSHANEWDWQIYLFGRIVDGVSGLEDSGHRAEAAFRLAWDTKVTPDDMDWIRARAAPTKKPRDPEG